MLHLIFVCLGYLEARRALTENKLRAADHGPRCCVKRDGFANSTNFHFHFVFRLVSTCAVKRTKNAQRISVNEDRLL